MLTSSYRADEAAQNLRLETRTRTAINGGHNTNGKLQIELQLGRRAVCNILRRLKTRSDVFYNKATGTWAIKSYA